MAVIYSVAINKGGVGKTTLATNLAAVIARENPSARVLLVDVDGQGNSSLAFGLVPANFETSMYDVMIGAADVGQVIVPVDHNLFIAPSNNDMNFIEMDVLTDLATFPEPLGLLRTKFEKFAESFDYIIVDTPPSLGLVTANVLNIANNRIIIPFSPESFSVQGLIRVVEAVRDFKATKNTTLEIAGVVGQIIDSRTNLHVELLQAARRYCYEAGVPFLDTVVPRSIRFANSTAYHEKPAVLTDGHAVAQSYNEIWKELVEIGTTKA